MVQRGEKFVAELIIETLDTQGEWPDGHEMTDLLLERLLFVSFCLRETQVVFFRNGVKHFILHR